MGNNNKSMGIPLLRGVRGVLFYSKERFLITPKVTLVEMTIEVIDGKQQ